MSTKYVNVDRATPMLLPPDLREWVAGNDLALFIVDAVESTDLSVARVNVRGTGDAQYPPTMMLALLIYGYATGVFSSRALERLTYDGVAARYLCANHHPDHDTIAKFRRENGALLQGCFVRVLELAREVGLLRLGTVSVDGTKIAARAAKNRSLRRAQLEAELAAVQRQVDALVAQAEQADGRGEDDGTTLPRELAHPRRRRDKLRTALAVLEQKQRERGEAKPEDTVNPTDPDSGITPTAQGPFIQGYNAQAAVSAEGLTLVVATAVVTQTNDRQQLAPTVAAIPPQLERPHTVLSDSGYDNGEQIAQLRQQGIRVYCPPQNVGPKAPRDPHKHAAWLQRVQRRDELRLPHVRRLYGRRSATSEPTFHVIKRLLGFGRFSLRGLNQVKLEWNLVALAYNCRKIAVALA
jgi:transposase